MGFFDGKKIVMNIQENIEQAKKLIEEKKLDTALFLLKNMLKESDVDFVDDIIFEIGKIYYIKQEYEKAEKEFIQVKNSIKYGKFVKNFLIKIYLFQQNYKESIKLIDEIGKDVLDKTEFQNTIVVYKDFINNFYEKENFIDLIAFIKNIKLKKIKEELYTYIQQVYRKTINKLYDLEKYNECLEFINEIGYENKSEDVLQEIISFYRKVVSKLYDSRKYNECIEFINKIEYEKNNKDLLQDIKNFYRGTINNLYDLEKYNECIEFINQIEYEKNDKDVLRDIKNVYDGIINKFNSCEKYEECFFIVDKIKDKNLTCNLEKIYKNIYSKIQHLNIIGEFEKAKEFYLKIDKYISNKEKKIKNILLNEYEIAQKKIILNSFPRFLQINLTTKCNLQCIMCGVHKASFEMTDKEVDDLLYVMPYIEKLTLQGGEIFCDRRIDKIIDSIYENDVKLEIITNGLLLNKERITKLLRIKDLLLCFSIDSSNKQTYESIRIGANFDVLTKNLEILKNVKKTTNNNAKIVLNMVVMRRNYKEIEEILDFAGKYEFNRVILRPIEGKTAGEYENFFEYNTDLNIIMELTNKQNKFIEIAKKYNLQLHNRLPKVDNGNNTEHKEQTNKINESKNVDKPVSLENDNKRMFCLIPFKKIYINYDGHLPNCVCAIPEEYEFNHNDNYVLAQWNSIIMQKYRRSIIEHKEMYICSKDCINNISTDINERNMLI